MTTTRTWYHRLSQWWPKANGVPESNGAESELPLPASARPARFSRDELEVACLEAHFCGRVYAHGGEKRTPVDEHLNMLNRALHAVQRHRREKNRQARRKPAAKMEAITPKLPEVRPLFV